MPRITVSIDLAHSPDDVWAEVADLASHDQWMVDAESIEFLPGPREGVGTRMQVATRVGPLRTDDLVEVTEWREPETIAVRHSGPVAGEGRFQLTPTPAGTRFAWSEELTFPWYLGGLPTATIAKPVLAWVWRRNLRGLAERLDRAR